MKQTISNTIKVLKNGIFRTLGANVLNKVIDMGSAMVITRLLTPAHYGIWGFVLNILSYLQLVTGFGLITGALQFGTENRGRGKAFDFFRYCIEKGLLINLSLVLIVGFIISILKLPIEGAKQYVLAILPILLLEFVVSIGQTILRAQNRINEYANALNVSSLSIAIGTCGGALFGVAGVVVGRYLANVAVILYELKLLHGEIHLVKEAGVLNKKDIRLLWNHSLFTGASSAMNCLVYSLDITLIAALLKNAEEVGLYRVGSLIPNALQFIPASIVIAILSTVIYNRDNIVWIRKHIRLTYMGLAACNAVICVVLVMLGPLVIRIISGTEYMGAVPVLRVLTLGYFFSGTFRTLSVNLLAAFRRVRYGLFISIVSCITDIVFNYALILRFGMIGAAYATLAVDIITAVLSFTYLNILLRKGTIYETV